MKRLLVALTVVALAGCGGASDSPPEARVVTVTTTVPTGEAPPAVAPSPPKTTPPPTTTTQPPSTTPTVPGPVEISMLPYLRSLPGSTSAGPNSTARAATITADGRYLIVRAAINGGLAEDANARVVSGASTADVPDLTPGNYLIKYAIDMEYSATEPGGPIDDIDVLATADFNAADTSESMGGFRPERGAGKQSDAHSFSGSTAPFAVGGESEPTSAIVSGSCRISTGGISTGTNCAIDIRIHTLTLVGPLPDDEGG
ncbi:MAG: hypothetical protein H6531_09205 [Actinobacteria bacterium]|nr:hypothetical protein [Actinomycetota bacterium]